jgi:taurine--2-oxoglutarate transaminase
MAKGITSAYLPLGVVAVSPEIAKSFDEKMFYGGLTYCAHPMSLAVAVATLKVMEDEQLVTAAKAMGVHLRANLERMKENHPCVGDVRSIGLFGAMELVKNRDTKESIVPVGTMGCPAMVEFQAFVRSQGVFMFNVGNILHTSPPLTITKEQIEETFEIIDEGLKIIDAVYEK